MPLPPMPPEGLCSENLPHRTESRWYKPLYTVSHGQLRPCLRAMTRFRNAPLGRALIGLSIGATIFAGHLFGLFRPADMTALDAACSLRPHPRDEAPVVVLVAPWPDPAGPCVTPSLAQREVALRNVLAAGAAAVGLDESFLAAGAGAPPEQVAALWKLVANPRCVVAVAEAARGDAPADTEHLRRVQWALLEHFEAEGGVVRRVRPPGAAAEGGVSRGFVRTVALRATARLPASRPAAALRGNLHRLSSRGGLLVDHSLPVSLVSENRLAALAAGPVASLRPEIGGRVVLLCGSTRPHPVGGAPAFLTSDSAAASIQSRSVVAWAIACALVGQGVAELPSELYGCLLIVAALTLTLALGDRGLRGKAAASAVTVAAMAAAWVAALVWGGTFVPLWPALATAAAVFVVATCLELGEAGYLIDREIRARPEAGSLPGERGEPSPAAQVASALRSLTRWHDLPAAALWSPGPGSRWGQVATVSGGGPARWQRAPSLQALARLATDAHAPVLGRWPSGLAGVSEWHALAVPVTGWAGQTAAVILASPGLPVPHGAVEFAVRGARQLLASRLLTSQIRLAGTSSGVGRSDLPLARRVAWLRSARLGRQRQAALAAAWRSGVHEAVVLFDLAGIPVLWNRHAEVLLGGEGKSLADTHFVTLLARASGLTARQVRDAGTDVVLHGTPFIFDLEDPSSARSYVGTLSQVPVGGETPGGLVVRCIDVTGVCRPTKVEARLTSMAAHEMRTPLTSIRGYADLVIEHTDRDSPAHRYAAAVHRQTQRLEAIVEELLAVSRLEAGRDELTLEPVDIVALAQHVVGAARPMAEDRGVKLSLSAEPRSVHVRGDARKLERMVENLVANAAKYSYSGASVRVSVRQMADRVLIIVSDTGPGIPAEDAPHVFEKFYRARTPETQAMPGTGLGLSIVKLIAEAHEGEVTLQTALGAGSTFTVSLPVDGPRRREAWTAA